MIIKSTGKDGDQSSEETEAALTSLHALVLQLFVEHLDDGRHLRAKQNYWTVVCVCVCVNVQGVSFMYM